MRKSCLYGATLGAYGCGEPSLSLLLLRGELPVMLLANVRLGKSVGVRGGGCTTQQQSTSRSA
jgi:hypothetical protein